MGSGPLIMIEYKNIQDVHLEISSRCNAACPDCPRNIRGYGIANEDFDLTTLTLAQIQSIFAPEFLQQLKSFLINGNYGDFITCRDGLSIVQYLHECNPSMRIIISTNASGQPDIWGKLGSISKVNVQFRLDGLEDTHHYYRQNTDYNLIINNAKKFIAAGGYATWAMIKFDYNQHQIAAAEELSKQLGFKSFTLIDQGRNTMPVFNNRGDFVRNIGQPPMDNTLQDLLDARRYKLENYFEINNNFRLNTTSKQINCVAKQNQSIYVQANGQVYPCCWTGFWPNKNVERLGNDQIKDLSNNNNALEVGLENAINWFSKLEQTWEIPTVAQGKSLICNETCGCN